MNYKWATMSVAINLTHLPAKEKSIARIVGNRLRKLEECFKHEMGYSFDKPYRRYRKGKNRCWECGLKIKRGTE